ncbi:MAG: hypothetical protein HY901_32485 [Deltaproteobacteria bacterium]|nr:hypothetical protein [Deltaproteobacteria bacterium]
MPIINPKAPRPSSPLGNTAPAPAAGPAPQPAAAATPPPTTSSAAQDVFQTGRVSQDARLANVAEPYKTICQVASAYMDREEKVEADAIRETGVGVRYGDTGKFALKTVTVLDANGRPVPKLDKNGQPVLQNGKPVYQTQRRDNTFADQCRILKDDYLSKRWAASPDQRTEDLTRFFAKHPELAEAASPTSPEAEKQYIEALVRRMKPTSCIGYVLEALGEGYKAAGMGEEWKALKKEVVAHGADTTFLLMRLQEAGWKAVYFISDTKNLPADVNPIYSDDHYVFRNKYVGKDGESFNPGATKYYGVTPDYAFVNFRANGIPNKEMLAFMDRHMQGVGTMMSGYHGYMVDGDHVRESHAPRMPWDATNLENRPWELLGHEYSVAAGKMVKAQPGELAAANGDKLGLEQSGIIMIPPGMWPEGTKVVKPGQVPGARPTPIS